MKCWESDPLLLLSQGLFRLREVKSPPPPCTHAHTKRAKSLKSTMQSTKRNFFHSCWGKIFFTYRNDVSLADRQEEELEYHFRLVRKSGDSSLCAVYCRGALTIAKKHPKSTRWRKKRRKQSTHDLKIEQY